MFADRNQDLARHVSALLRARRLIFDVYTRSALLYEQLCKLHNCRKTAMSGISVGNNWSEVVDVREILALRLGNAKALLSLLAVVEELSEPKMLYFVWDGGLKRRQYLQ